MRRTGLHLLLPSIVLLSTVLIGCGRETRYSGGEPGTRPPGAVVSLSPSTTEIVGQYLPNVQLQGRTAACNFPQFVTKARVLAGVKPDYEQIAQLKPPMIVLDDSLYSSADIDRIKALGIPLFEFKANSIDGFIDELRKFGVALGAESELSPYVDKILTARQVAQTQTGSGKASVAILTGGTSTSHLIAGTNSFVADEVKAAGGVPVGPDVDKFVPLNVEELVQQNPDVIFISTETAKPEIVEAEVKALTNDPRLKSIKAIQSNRVYGILGDALLRKGSRVDVVIGGISRALAGAK